MNQPLVSIIIPCYNQGHYLSEALESVQKQTYEIWECIIINDGSSDNTFEVAQKWCDKDKRFKVLSKKNSGLSSSRNYGIKVAKGEFFQFLDADDKIQSNKIKNSIELFKSNPIYDIVYTYSLFFETAYPERLWASRHLNNQEWMPKVSGYGRKILSDLLDWNIMTVSSPLIKSSTIKEVGFFDETLHSFEDWDFWIRCAIKNKYFIYLPYTQGNATEIRTGYNSMMSNTLNMDSHQILIRKKYRKYKLFFVRKILASKLKNQQTDKFNKIFNYFIRSKK